MKESFYNQDPIEMKVELKKRKGVFSDRDVFVIFKDGKLMEGFITFDIQEATARFLE